MSSLSEGQSLAAAAMAGASSDAQLTRETYLLMLRFLSASPCQDAFASLRDAAERLGLLGETMTLTGESAPATYDQAMARLGAPPPPSHLPELLGRLLALSRHQEPAETLLPAPAWSLLRGGSLSLAPRVSSSEGGSGSRAPPPSVQWGSAFRRALPPAREALQRRLGHGQLGATMRLPALAARECGARLASCPPRALFGPAGNGRLGALQHHATLVGHQEPVYCCVFDRSGARLVTGSDDANLKMWCVRSGLLLRTLRGHMGEINEIVISPDNAAIASASNDHTARIWRLADGEPLATLAGHSSPVCSLSFAKLLSPEGTARLLTIGHDGSVLLWDDPAGREAPSRPMRLRPPSTELDPLPASSQLHPPASAGVLRAPASAASCAFSPSARHAAVGLTEPPHLQLWALDEPAPHSSPSRKRAAHAAAPPPPQPAVPIDLPSHSKEVPTMAFSHRGDALLTGSRDGTARVWHFLGRTASSQLLCVLGHRCGAPSDSSGSGAREARSSADASLNSAAHAEAVAAHATTTTKPLAIWIEAVAWSCDDSLAFTSEQLRKTTKETPCVSGCVRVWSRMHSRSEPPLLLHTLGSGTAYPTFALGAHPCDPWLLASAGYDGFTRVWDLRKGMELSAFSSCEGAADLAAAAAIDDQGEIVVGGARSLLDVSWSPDGNSLAATSLGGLLLLYGLSPPWPALGTAPRSQYYLADSNPLRLDAFRGVIDSTNDQEPHEVPRGPLVDEHGAAHAAAHQPPASCAPLPLPGLEREQAGLRLLVSEVREAEAHAMAAAAEAAVTGAAHARRETRHGKARAHVNAAGEARVLPPSRKRLHCSAGLLASGSALPPRAPANREGRERRRAAVLYDDPPSDEDEEGADSADGLWSGEGSSDGESDKSSGAESNQGASGGIATSDEDAPFGVLASRRRSRPRRGGASGLIDDGAGGWEGRRVSSDGEDRGEVGSRRVRRAGRAERAARHAARAEARAEAHGSRSQQWRRRDGGMVLSSRPRRNAARTALELLDVEGSGQEGAEDEGYWSPEWEGEERQRRKRARRGGKARRSRRWQEEEEEEEEVVVVEEEKEVHPADWLRSVETPPNTYLPQLGDRVIYLRRGHEAALLRHPEGEGGEGEGEGGEGCGSGLLLPPYVLHPDLPLAVECEVIALQAFPPRHTEDSAGHRRGQAGRKQPGRGRATVECVRLHARLRVLTPRYAPPSAAREAARRPAQKAEGVEGTADLSANSTASRVGTRGSANRTARELHAGEEWEVAVPPPDAGCPDFLVLEAKYAGILFSRSTHL